MNLPTEFHDWVRLPPDIKVLCMNKMDFLSRIRMRATSKIERELVEKVNNNILKLSYYAMGNEEPHEDIEISQDEKYKIIRKNNVHFGEEMMPLMAFLLRTGTIEYFFAASFWPFSEMLRTNKKYRIKSLRVDPSNEEGLMIMKGCDEKIIETVTIHENFKEIPVEEIVALPSLKSVKTWNLLGVTYPISVLIFIAYWFTIDVEIGTNLNTQMFGYETFELITDFFSQRIEHQTDNKCTIRIDDRKRVTVTVTIIEVKELIVVEEFIVAEVHL
ncbi:hypothetical protein L3Y34_013796 [Caenorhabditis briggsae]|uniref:F-box domain-containing protein n=1 Tax=Caenorhabditis briggsae TaxID=6238 RepID=A0AAE9CX19_CAEBR|nr:hypothetical protein L3Y34_013796 [Caenorhabditis briggsae]